MGYDNMKNYLKFTENFLKVFNEVVSKNFGDSEHDKEFAEVLNNHLFDKKDTPKIMSIKHSKKDLRLGKLFQNYNEIATSIERLENIEIFINHFPNYKIYKKKGITKITYLKYHIENYLNEVYLLKERLIKWLNVISKFYKYNENILKRIKRQKKIIEEAFENISADRSRHIHQYRYSDNDISRLDSWEVINKGIQFNKKGKNYKLNNSLLLYEKYLYRDIRKKWVEKIKINNKNTMKVINIYFKFVYELIFNKDKKLKL